MDFPNTRFGVQNYSQFINNQVDTGDARKKSFQLASLQEYQDQFANDMLDSSDITTIMRQKFVQKQYPVDLMTANIYCPICGKIVYQSQSFSAYDSQAYKRRFLAHNKCLSNQTYVDLNDLFVQVQEMTFIADQKPKEKYKGISIGQRQFCVQLSISHPLSDFKFIKQIAKINSNGTLIRWRVAKDEYQQFTSFQPNIICFPFVDFRISFVISQINSQEGKKIFKSYVNLSRAKLSSFKSIVAKSDQIMLQLAIFSTEKQKQQLTSRMNFKYRYPIQTSLPIIQLQTIELSVPQQQEVYDQYYESNQTHTINELLTQNCQKSSQTSYSQSHLSKYSMYQQNRQPSINSNSNHLSFSPETKHNDKSNSVDKQRVDFQKLILTNKLTTYVRNSAQSRNFQKFLDETTPSQIQTIMNNFYQDFHELIVDDYANYTAQKLFQKCNTEQRLKILQKLFPLIPNLVRNKQGTHTIQAFVSYFNVYEEIQLIVQSIKQQFQQLCFNPISTHFIQKIIKQFPIQSTIQFYSVVNKRFLEFATDKNAMCVLKYMLKTLKQKQANPITVQIKKHFINSITLNTPKIIQDCYGNYVIQFCYQFFGEAKSSGITEMIIEKFVQFSLQKYSSSVVSKCINTYWTDKQYVNKLKDSLYNEGILQMYRNKDGNKILLDLMDKNENTVLWEKIHMVAQSQGAKFYHERWGVQIGIRSGPVGLDFNSFAQAADRQQQRSHHTKQGKRSKKK